MRMIRIADIIGAAADADGADPYREYRRAALTGRAMQRRIGRRLARRARLARVRAGR